MNAMPANVKAWLAEPMSKEVTRAVERLARSADVRHSSGSRWVLL